MTAVRLLPWAIQLALPAAILAYTLVREVKGPAPGTHILVAAAFSGVWLLVGILALAVPRSRQWVIDNSREIALSLMVGTVCLAAIDLVLTISGLVPTVANQREYSILYRPSVGTVHRMQANTMTLREGADPVRVGERGYRGPDVSVPKPTGTKRLVFLGGSQVHDFGGENWPWLAGDLLRTRGLSVDVVNGGVPGHRTTDSVNKLLTDLWLLEPDVIVLCQAWNDIKYFADLDPNRTYRDLVPPFLGDWRIEPSGLDRLLTASAFYRLARIRIIETVSGAEGRRDTRTRTKVNDWGVQQYKLNVETTVFLGRRLGAKVFLCKQARQLPATDPDSTDYPGFEFSRLPLGELLYAFEQCDRVVEQACASGDCEILDMNQALSGRAELFTDHVHFSEKGSRRAAEIVAAALQQTLDESAP